MGTKIQEQEIEKEKCKSVTQQRDEKAGENMQLQENLKTQQNKIDDLEIKYYNAQLEKNEKTGENSQLQKNIETQKNKIHELENKCTHLTQKTESQSLEMKSLSEQNTEY